MRYKWIGVSRYRVDVHLGKYFFIFHAGVSYARVLVTLMLSMLYLSGGRLSLCRNKCLLLDCPHNCLDPCEEFVHGGVLGNAQG